MNETPHESSAPNSDRRSPRVEIEYCTMCRWLLRAGWTAQELLTTFPTELAEVALVPGTGGTFDVRLDGELIYSRKAAGGFPELKHLKQLVRDRIDPERDLGHSDRDGDGYQAARPGNEQPPLERQSGDVEQSEQVQQNQQQ